MNNEIITVITFIAALGCGLVAGIFYGFSTFIMKALYRLPSMQGITAMQSINITVICPLFMIAFFGTAVICITLTLYSLLNWNRPESALLFVGSLLYIIGTIVVTIVFNVPRNNSLADVDPTSSEGANVWERYVPSWNFWNHVRTAAALAAAAVFSYSLLP